MLRQVISSLSIQAENNNYSIDDLACTLLIAIATPNGIAAMQIGDGFITVRYPEQDPLLLFSPDKGEYINETTFVTSTNALKDMKVVVQPGQPEFICASTDGLERLAIRLSDWTPFSSFLSTTRTIPAGNGQLRRIRRILTEFFKFRTAKCPHRRR